MTIIRLISTRYIYCLVWKYDQYHTDFCWLCCSAGVVLASKPGTRRRDWAEVRRRPAIQVTTNWTWYSWAWPHQHGENNHWLNSNSRVTSFTLLQLRNTIYLLYFMHRMQNEEWSWVHRCLLSLMWVPHRAAAGQGGAVRANGEKLLLFVIDGDVLLLSTLYLNIIYQPAPFLAPLPGPRVWLQAASSLARPPSMPLDGVDTPR